MPICSECHNQCKIKSMDFGIEAYEYWGATGVDIQMAVVSDCCEAEAFQDLIDGELVDRIEEMPDYFDI